MEDELAEVETRKLDTLYVENHFLVAEAVKAEPMVESEGLLRLRVAIAGAVEQTCEKLQESFERKLAQERAAHDARWRETELRLKKDLELKIFEAIESAKFKFEAADARRKLMKKRVPCGGDEITSESELKRLLAEKEAELDMTYATYRPTLEAQRTAQKKLLAARDAALEAGKTTNAFAVKVMGVLDPLILVDAGLGAEEISALQERLRHPDFHPFKTVLKGDDAMQIPDLDHPELVALRFEYGPAVVDEVIRCVQELDSWNPSGRYHVAVPWDNSTDTELDPADVIRRIAQQQPSPPPPPPPPPAMSTTTTTDAEDPHRNNDRHRVRPTTTETLPPPNTTQTARLLASRGGLPPATGGSTWRSRGTLFSFPWGHRSTAPPDPSNASSGGGSSSGVVVSSH